MATLSHPDRANSAAPPIGRVISGEITLRLIVLAAALAVATAVAAPAAAQSLTKPEFTASVGYARFADGSEDWDGHAVAVRGAARLHRYFGVEAEGNLGLGSSDIGGVDLSMNHTVAGYVVAYLPLSENVDLYARAGYGSTEFEIDFGGGDVFTESYDGLALGIGGQYFFDGSNNGVRMDVTRHEYDELDGGFDAVSFSYVRRF